jgi:putative ABC transport system permease protein
VLYLVVRKGMASALSGLAFGLVASFGLTRLMSTLLYGVRPNDIATLAAVSIVLAGVALLATYIPARRAMQVDPIVALRYE